jgi:hypothetical protein
MNSLLHFPSETSRLAGANRVPPTENRSATALRVLPPFSASDDETQPEAHRYGAEIHHLLNELTLGGDCA